MTTEALFLGLKLAEWITLLAILIGPMAAVLITEFNSKSRRLKEQQHQTFRTLMSTRHLPSDANYSTAINMIPVDFSGNKQIYRAWQEYIATITFSPKDEEKEKHHQVVVTKQTVLIDVIAKFLGYEISQTDIQNSAYAAGGFIARDNMTLDAMNAWVRIANALEYQNQALIDNRDHGDSGNEGE